MILNLSMHNTVREQYSVHYTLCSEKTLTYVFFYVSVENVQISTKFLECLGGNKYSTGRKVSYLLLLVTSC